MFHMIYILIDMCISKTRSLPLGPSKRLRGHRGQRRARLGVALRGAGGALQLAAEAAGGGRLRPGAAGQRRALGGLPTVVRGPPSGGARRVFG